MPRDPRYATEPDEQDEDELDRESVDESGDEEADDYLTLAIRAARVVLHGLEARQAGDDEEARRSLKQYDRLWPRLSALVEGREAEMEAEHG